jgi:hypothetical protein
MPPRAPCVTIVLEKHGPFDFIDTKPRLQLLKSCNGTTLTAWGFSGTQVPWLFTFSFYVNDVSCEKTRVLIQDMHGVLN